MKNLYLFIQINFIPFKVILSRYNALMPTFFPIVETLVKFDFWNLVVVKRYALSFWRNGHEERVQCETAPYRDAKTTSCLPKISFETVLSDPLEMPIVSVRSLIVNRGLLFTNSLIWLTCSSSVYFDGRSGRSKSSTRSLPSLKSLYRL